MHRIEAEFEIVTPMFLGGADPKGSAELRAASIKGALRFWWRAGVGAAGGNLERIHGEERGTSAALTSWSVKRASQLRRAG
ncbi:MAG: type III-B CRISPR module RAMP protein Cmr1 [Hyphomicrobiaceae bacterium]